MIRNHENYNKNNKYIDNYLIIRYYILLSLKYVPDLVIQKFL
jgi:hypothetical protein